MLFAYNSGFSTENWEHSGPCMPFYIQSWLLQKNNVMQEARHRLPAYRTVVHSDRLIDVHTCIHTCAYIHIIWSRKYILNFIGRGVRHRPLVSSSRKTRWFPLRLAYYRPTPCLSHHSVSACLVHEVESGGKTRFYPTLTQWVRVGGRKILIVKLL